MKHKNALLFFLLLSGFGILAFAPRQDGGIEKLVAALQRWTEAHPQEKIHLHMDKPYYALGDTIWFKAYVTVGSRHHLSAQSQAMYVELINEKDSILQTLKLPVIAGLGMGDFTLDDEFNDGNYRIRAYTQWMRNAGDDYFYERNFTVGSPGGEGVVAKVDYKYTMVDERPLVLAQLSYKDDEGRPLVDQEIRYDIILNNKVMYTKALDTDAEGRMTVNIANNSQLNEGSAFIRTTIFLKGRKKVVKTFPIKAAMAKNDIQFFPEGGTLVNGVTSRIAFKALNVEGLGIAIKGTVMDNKGQEVIAFESQHAGMGSFVIKPEAGKQYTANIRYADETQVVVKLPAAQAEGYALSVYQPAGDSVLVRVSASAALVSRAGVVGLIAQSGGETIYASRVTVAKSINSFWVPKKSFPSGIAQFTLFDYKNEPINERVAFIRNDDQMKVTLKTAKKLYKSRERVEMQLESADPFGKPVAGTFSVSVIDESKVPLEESQESTIFSNILLTSDLKGYIEQPNYYFTSVSDTVNKALDNLMLTQGYRRFSWKAISAANNITSKPMFKAESLGMEVSGKVLTLGNDPLANGKVTLLSLRSGILRDTVTDAQGRFSFADMVLTDSIRFAVQARTEKNKKKVEIVLDTIPKILLSKNRNLPAASTNVSGMLDHYLASVRAQDEAQQRMGGLGRVQRLNEVVIRARKLRNTQFSPQGSYKVPEGHSEQTFILDDPNSCATLGICLQGRLGGVNFIPLGMVRSYPHTMVPGAGMTPMLVYLDGRKVDDEIEVSDIFDSNVIDPTDIGKIEVVRRSIPLMTMLGGPSILIVTKRGTVRRRFEPSIANINPKGYNKVKEFYSPRYDYNNAVRNPVDMRSTIYWNANIKTHGLGKTTFSYFNADGPGKYKVTVEGMNAAGELARTVYRYEVEAGSNATASVKEFSPVARGFVNAVDSLRKRMPIEKVFLHTDKSYYSLGDTLWFKSYLLNGTGLTASSTSGLLYVELLNDSADVVRRISVPVNKGLGWAQIPLPRTIFHEGAYTLRAYTHWMQNFGEAHFYTKRFYMGVPTQDTWLVKSGSTVSKVEGTDRLNIDLELTRSDLTPAGLRELEVRLMEGSRERSEEIVQSNSDGRLSLKYDLKDRFDTQNMRLVIRTKHKNDGDQLLTVPLVVRRDQEIDLQFLPEGGHLVAGLKSVVAFKALGEDGKGTQVKGEVLDSKGNNVASFSSLYNGMGSFELTPIEGEVYTARLSSADASKSYTLPLASTAGTVMNVMNEERSDSVVVSVKASNGVINMDSTWYVTVLSAGRVSYIEPVNDRNLIHFIPKKQLPSGVSRITLLRGKTPVNERLVFIDHNDRLKFKIEQNKEAYYKRDSVSVSILVTDKNGQPVKGNFSMAVTDDSQVRADSVGNYDIGTNLLLTSELKGAVETPGYYLKRKDPESWKALDNLLLTQGWSNYEWKEVFKAAEPIVFEPELKLKIKGTVTNIFKKPISGAQMLISSQKPAFLASTVSDTSGRYLFENLPQIDSGSFFIQARTPKGKPMNFGEVTVDAFKAPKLQTRYRDQLMPWYINTDPVQLNYVNNVMKGGDELRRKNSGIALKEVEIRSRKIIRGAYKTNRVPDKVFDEQDIKESGAMSLYQILRQKLPGFHLVNEEGMPTAKLNKYIVDISADGNPIPVRMNANFTDEELFEQLNSMMIASFVGIEVYYTNRYLRKNGKYGYLPNSGSSGALSPKQLLAINNAHHLVRSRGSDAYLRERKLLAQEFSTRQNEFATIHITTRSGAGGFFNNRPDYVTLRPLPVMHAKEFYSPKYTMSANEQIPDYRATVYWSPEIVTDRFGKAKVSFYTADIPGSYTINVQGSDMSGAVGSSTGKLKVIKQSE